MKIRCIVYSGETELFQEEGEEGADRMAVAIVARERVREEYPLLEDVKWRFETIYPKFMPYAPPVNRLEAWDEHVRVYWSGIGREAPNDD